MNANEPSTISLSYSELENETNNQNIIQEPASSVSIELKSDSNEIEMSSHEASVDIPSDIDELEMNESRLTFAQRIKRHIINLFNYLKHDGVASAKERENKLFKDSHGVVTGHAFNNHETPNLGCVDIDVKHDASNEKKEEIRQQILSKLSDDDLIEQTGNGGLHIYCNLDGYYLDKNRLSNQIKLENYAVDVFGCVSDARSIIVYAGSRTIKNANTEDEQILEYKWVRGNENSVIKRSMYEVLQALDLESVVSDAVKKSNKKEYKTVKKLKEYVNEQKPKLESEHDKFILDKDIIALLVAGITEPIEIHNWNDSANMSMEDERLGLWHVFLATEAIEDEKLKKLAYEKITDVCTKNALMNFNESLKRFNEPNAKHIEPSLWHLREMIRIHNPSYYATFIEPMLKGFHLKKIDFSDDFSLNTFMKNAAACKYNTLSHAAKDLSKIYRYVAAGESYYIEKAFNVDTNRFGVVFVKAKSVEQKLKDVRLFEKNVAKPGEREKMKTFYALDALKKYKSNLIIDGVKFNSKLDSVFNIFTGYKYDLLDEYDESIIDDFKKLTLEAICDEDESIYDYLIKLISWWFKHPGEKAGAAIVMKGTQGAGKNTFTDILCELFAGYSATITEMNELVGTFNSVIENCMLIVCNELRNMSNGYVANIDALKAIITDPTIRINEKNQPRRTADNVANFIFISNNSKPLIIPPNDRRYLVLDVNAKFTLNKEGAQLLARLHQKDKAFYDNVFTYFMNQDLSDFNPRVIPVTRAKLDLVEGSMSKIDAYIVSKYKELIEGIPSTQINEAGFRAYCSFNNISDWDFKTFRLQLKDHCIKGGQLQIWRNGKNSKYYKLTEAYAAQYNPELYNPKIEGETANNEEEEEE